MILHSWGFQDGQELHVKSLPTNSHPIGAAFWFFGRSGAGKTTLTSALAQKLKQEGYPVLLVDGDILRSGLCHDLGFDERSRTENHRRAAELAKLAVDQGFIVIGATMCPLPSHRLLLREILGEQLRVVYLEASHEACAQRDPKGLYLQFAEGKLDHFDKDSFHAPLLSECDKTIHTGEKPPEDCALEVESYVRSCLHG